MKIDQRSHRYLSASIANLLWKRLSDSILQMSVNQTRDPYYNQSLEATVSLPPTARPKGRRSIRRVLLIGGSLFLALLFIGRHGYSHHELRTQAVGIAVANWTFDLPNWMAGALSEKAGALWSQPADAYEPAESTELVRTYIDRAQRIGQIQGEINRLLSNEGVTAAASDASQEEQLSLASLQLELAQLRELQDVDRPAVEQVIQQQVGDELVAEGIDIAGLPAPPVLFTFTEPPKKLIVSPRDRIESVDGRMLTAEIDPTSVDEIEQILYGEHDLSAYITNIGGLGAFPTMVVDRASLRWVLSTVAHEWVHNYLNFFPMGFNYGTSSELIILNESVAEIVGNEIGDRVLAKHYPDLVPSEPTGPQVRLSDIPVEQVQSFSFGREMRKTRLEVDRLLAEGKIDEAERYMEDRRQLFVENGYPLRVLNQAYFAFHGSYVTSPAASDPIGPKMEHLRELVPDIQTFLQVVRSILTADELDAVIAEWESM